MKRHPCGRRGTYDVLGVRRERDLGALGALAAEHVRDDVRVRHRGHGREAVVLGLAEVDLVAELLDRAFRALQLLAVPVVGCRLLLARKRRKGGNTHV